MRADNFEKHACPARSGDLGEERLLGVALPACCLLLWYPCRRQPAFRSAATAFAGAQYIGSMRRMAGPFLVGTLLAAAAGQAYAAAGRLPQAAAAARHQPVDAAEATRLFQAGSAALQAHHLGAAHADFAHLVTLAPQVAAAHSAFGAVLLAEGDLRTAATELARARQLDPNDTQALINLGVVQSRLGQFTEAVRLFHGLPAGDLRSLQPAEALAYATALSHTGDRAAAEAVLEQAVASQPSAELCDALGTLEAQGAHFDVARQHFAEALKINPDYAPAHAHTGSVFLLQGDGTAATAELQRAVSLGDSSPETQVELGRALSASGHDREALDVLRKHAAQPLAPETQYAFALALQGAGDAKGALPLFAKYVATHPDNATALTNYGLALVQTGDAKAALGFYARAKALVPSNATLLEDTGVAYLQTNDIDHAIEQFQAALQMEGNNPMLHYDLGLAYKLKDNLALAITELERAEALDPKLPDPPYTLGVIRTQQGNAAEAVHQLQQAVALRPDNGDAWALLGAEQKDAGNLDAAAEALHRASALSPEQPSTHVTLAAVLSAKGDRDGAAAERKIAAELSRKAMTRQRADFALQSGRAMLAKGDLAGAEVQLHDAISADPNRKEAHVLLAEALQKQGRPADALAERQLAEKLPGSSTTP